LSVFFLFVCLLVCLFVCYTNLCRRSKTTSDSEWRRSRSFDVRRPTLLLKKKKWKFKLCQSTTHGNDKYTHVSIQSILFYLRYSFIIHEKAEAKVGRTQVRIATKLIFFSVSRSRRLDVSSACYYLVRRSSVRFVRARQFSLATTNNSSSSPSSPVVAI